MSSLIGQSSIRAPAQATGLKGSGLKQITSAQFTPEQMSLFSNLLGHVGPDSFLSRLASGDQSQFGQLEAPALRQFGELQSGIANRYSGAGLGGRRSSGFQNAQTSAASNFAQALQSQRLGIQRQSLQDLMSNSSDLLGQRPYDNFFYEKKKKPSFLQQLLGSFAGGASENAGELMKVLPFLI